MEYRNDVGSSSGNSASDNTKKSRRRISYPRLSSSRRTRPGVDIREEDQEQTEDDVALETSSDQGLLLDLDADDFDAVSWLNVHLAARVGGDADGQYHRSNDSAATATLSSLESGISSFLTTLLLTRTDVDSSIASEILSTSKAVPAISSRIPAIARNATQVSDSLRTYTSQLQPKSISNSATALAHLAELHHLQSQLTSYQALLRLASSWSTLSADVSMLLAEALSPSTTTADCIANFNSASLRLSEARDSLEVFGDSQEAKEKTDLLSSLTNQFLACVGPRLAEEIRKLQDRASPDSTSQVAAIEVVQSFARILNRTGHADSFNQLWRRTRRAELVDKWLRVTSATSSKGDAASSALSVQISPLLTDLVELIDSERYYATLFAPADPILAIHHFIMEILQDVMPGLASRIQALIQDCSELTLAESIRIIRIMRERGRDIEKIFNRMTLASASSKHTAESTAQHPKASPNAHYRRLSSFSGSRGLPYHLPRQRSDETAHQADAKPGTLLSQQDDVYNERLQAFSHAFYSSSLSLWNSYGTQENYLLRSLHARELRALGPRSTDAETGLTSLAYQLSQSLSTLMELSEDSISRCLELTRGLAGAALLSAVDDVASRAIAPAVADVQSVCTQAWARELNMVGRSDASVWAFFEQIASFLSTAQHMFHKASMLQGRLVEALRDVAVAMFSFDLSTSPVPSASLIEKLAQLTAHAQAGLLGPNPSGGEIAVLITKTHLVTDPEEQRIRKAMVSLKGARNRAHGNVSAKGTQDGLRLKSSPAPSAPLSTHELDFLPGLAASMDNVLSPVLHSLLVLPLIPLISELSQYPNLPHWVSRDVPGQVANEYQLSMPSFSLGPTEVMQAIGEGMLGLVRELELWIGNAGVRWGVSMLNRIKREFQQISFDGVGSNLEDSLTPRAGISSKQERRKSAMLPFDATEPASPEMDKKQRRKSSFLPADEETKRAGGTSEEQHDGIVSPSRRLSLAPSQRENKGTLPVDNNFPSSISPQPISPSASREAMLQNEVHGEHESRSDAEDLLPAYLSLLLSHFVEFHFIKQTLPKLPRPHSKHLGTGTTREARSSPVPTMTDAGWKQLNVDVEYLDQILGALDRNHSQDHSSGDEAVLSDQTVGKARDVRLRDWHAVVGQGQKKDSDFGVDSFGYRILQAGSDTQPGQSGPTQGANSIREMLQSQRKRGGGGVTGSGVSTPRNGEAKPSGRSGVDLEAMNVGMGW